MNKISINSIFKLYTIMNYESMVDNQKMIESIEQKIDKMEKKYYNDTLDLLNLLFKQKAKSILKIKCHVINLDDNIFLFYNKMITKYNLNIPEFDISKFDDTDDNQIDNELIIDIAHSITKNLLLKLNYSVVKNYDKNINKYVLYIKSLR